MPLNKKNDVDETPKEQPQNSETVTVRSGDGSSEEMPVAAAAQLGAEAVTRGEEYGLARVDDVPDEALVRGNAENIEELREQVERQDVVIRELLEAVESLADRAGARVTWDAEVSRFREGEP